MPEPTTEKQEDQLRELAHQLRRPEGELGKKIANELNEGNLLINQSAIAALDLKPDDNVLEIGMGNGAFVTDVTQLADGVTYTGFDFSELMVSEASEANQDLVDLGNARFICGSIDCTNNDLPFVDESFDAVLSVNTLYFWNTTAALQNIQRLLKPGGVLILAIRPKRIMEKYPFVRYGFNMFSARDVADLLSEHDFAEIEVEEHDEPARDFEGIELEIATVIARCRKRYGNTATS